ncbi:MAG: helicase-exonuclease AddAB subunit AddA [Lachnospiraceae bacterium]|nr:helicase-exonuclease AddAB subunit AddA [Lachnospiraceae bacterium]
MAGVTYTEEQQKAIQTRNANLLVSAAAGSGKTAVLTERIISLITDKEHPVDIDRMLVVTFTKASAAEMRERIGKAINERLEQTPEDGHLLRQMALLYNAQITTIDSFCLYLLRNNFGDIGLDPAFRVMEQGEQKLLMKDTMDELLEERYQDKENQDFFLLAECYGENGKDDLLEEITLSLYDYAMSHPYPLDWLENAAKSYAVETFEELEQKEWWKDWLAENERLIEQGLTITEEAEGFCRESDGPLAYLPAIEAQKSLLTELKGNRAFDRRYEILHGAEIPGFGRAKKTDDKELCDRVKACRESVKKILERLSGCYYDTSEHILAAQKGSKAAAGALIRLAEDFIERFGRYKRERNVVDFSDMEHLALEVLLQKSEDGTLVPTRAAKEYQDYFDCVMVDEYQDSNYVQEYLLKTVAREDNYFMVGDVKQSIYRFRLARPEIFMKKYALFKEEAAGNIRIDLNRNFRSRREVLESVNDVFEKIMTGKSAGVSYDERARLYPGAEYPVVEGQSQNTELVLIEKPKEYDDTIEAGNAKELEAYYIAGRIRDMMKRHFQIYDSKSKTARAVSYADIVILLRAMDDQEEALRKVFEKQGIPVYSATKTGYFSTLEVRTIMSALQVLDNPRQDIPLYGMMTSYIGGFTEEEAAEIKSGRNRKDGDRCLYDDVCSYREDTAAKPLEAKTAALLDMIAKYRRKAKYTGIRELLEELYEKTGYLDYVTALPGGTQRRANLMMLLERASDFEATSYHGLFHFVRYISQLKAQEVDYGEAGILDEHADVVRIMTIHKSKGLEFPVCFLCGLGKKINRRDVSKPVLLESEYGIGLDHIDPLLRVRRPTILKKAIADKILTDAISEEMRILYVAMTRAKEKLIMTGSVNDFEKTMEKWKKGGSADYDNILQYSTYLDFLLAAYLGSGKGEKYILSSKMEEMIAHTQRDDLVTTLSKEALKDIGIQSDPSWEKVLEERFSVTYPYPELAGLYTKTTVSELKKAAYEDTEAYQMFDTQQKEAYVPKFIRGEEEASLGSKRGTAVHRIMELIEYRELWSIHEDAGVLSEGLRQREGKTDQKVLEDQVRRIMEKNIVSGKLTKEAAELINVRKCARFLASDLAGRMIKADREGKLYKEKSFFIGIPAKELKEEFPQEETVLVQGVIDVYFEEEDGLVLLDYKTDRVAEAEELRSRYHIQMELYARALEQITQKSVKERLIYSFSLETSLKV